MRQQDQRAEALGEPQTAGDSPVEVLVESLQERSRSKMMEKLRRFITVDNHEAVAIGDLEKTPAKRRRRYVALIHRYHECGRQKMEPSARG